MGNFAWALDTFKMEGVIPMSSEPITMAVGPVNETSYKSFFAFSVAATT